MCVDSSVVHATLLRWSLTKSVYLHSDVLFPAIQHVMQQYVHLCHNRGLISGVVVLICTLHLLLILALLMFHTSIGSGGKTGFW